MNPTLATRSQRRRQLLYWRIHPPGPFVVDGALPTALAVRLPGNGSCLGAGSGALEQELASGLEEWAAPNEAVRPVSAGPLQIRILHGPIPRLAPEPRAAGASQARVAGDSITAPLRPATQAPPSDEVHAAVPAPELLPLPPPLTHGPLVAPATTVPVPAVARAEKAACLVPQPPLPSQDHDTVDWLATLIWLAVLAIDGCLALAEVLQKLPPGPVQRQSGTAISRSRPNVLGFGHPRPRQILES